MKDSFENVFDMKDSFENVFAMKDSFENVFSPSEESEADILVSSYKTAPLNPSCVGGSYVQLRARFVFYHSQIETL